jgi:hypothetical protein
MNHPELTAMRQRDQRTRSFDLTIRSAEGKATRWKGAEAHQARMQSRQPSELLCRLDQVGFLHGPVAFPFELDLGLAREQGWNGLRIGFLHARQNQFCC